jgi:hypothetical protein
MSCALLTSMDVQKAEKIMNVFIGCSLAAFICLLVADVFKVD